MQPATELRTLFEPARFLVFDGQAKSSNPVDDQSIRFEFSISRQNDGVNVYVKVAGPGHPLTIDNPEIEQRVERLVIVLDTLKRRGFKQSQVARELGIPTNYLSDLRHGRRMISEPLARTIALVCGASFEWMWLGDGVQSAPTIRPEGVPLNESLTAPILTKLYVGEPRTSKDWDGSVLVLSGRAAAEATAAVMPYILRLALNDKAGRLRKGDLILITQEGSATTEIAVIQTAKRLLLARRQGRAWHSIDTGRAVSGKSEVVGEALGIVWGSL